MDTSWLDELITFSGTETHKPDILNLYSFVTLDYDQDNLYNCFIVCATDYESAKEIIAEDLVEEGASMLDLTENCGQSVGWSATQIGHAVPDITVGVLHKN